MKRTIAILFFLLSTALFASGQNFIRAGSTAPLFSSVTLDGDHVALSEMRGSVVVIAFWSTKCEICRHEIPKLNRVREQFRQKNVSFLAFSMEKEDKINGFLRSNPFNFQIVPDSFGVVFQYADRTKDGYIDMGFPAFYVVDQKGVVQYRASGFDRTDALNETVSRLVKN